MGGGCGEASSKASNAPAGGSSIAIGTGARVASTASSGSERDGSRRRGRFFGEALAASAAFTVAFATALSFFTLAVAAAFGAGGKKVACAVACLEPLGSEELVARPWGDVDRDHPPPHAPASVGLCVPRGFALATHAHGGSARARLAD